jgi:hypothetical protein
MNASTISKIYLKAAHEGTPVHEAKAFAKKLRDLKRTGCLTFLELNSLLSSRECYRLDECYRFQARVESLWAEIDRENTGVSAEPPTSFRRNRGASPTSTAHNSMNSTTNVNSKTQTKSSERKRKTTKTSASQNAWRYDQNRNPGPEYIWIGAYSYTTNTCRAVNVRGHWRKRRVPKPKSNAGWKYDRNANPGTGWTWTSGFTTKNYSVRSHWRSARTCWRKST